MKQLSIVTIALLALSVFSATASADNDFGIGVKAGTLGLGIEGRWEPLPYLDLRLGMNQYDYDHDGDQAGIDYDATLSLDTAYATANLRFPLSPFRITAGLHANNNELLMTSVNPNSVVVGGTSYSAADVASLHSVSSFDSTAPYVGIGFDFNVLDKVGLTLDLGVLLQGDPDVTLTANGLLANDPAFQQALEAERQELIDEVDSMTAWPVVSLGFVYLF